MNNKENNSSQTILDIIMNADMYKAMSSIELNNKDKEEYKYVDKEETACPAPNSTNRGEAE